MRSRLCRCGAIVTGYCATCNPHNKTTTERGYDGQWKRLSEIYRSNNPLCEVCLLHGRTEPATEVHHIVPIKQSVEKRLDQKNIIAVCASCHVAIEGKPDPRPVAGTGGGGNLESGCPVDASNRACHYPQK